MRRISLFILIFTIIATINNPLFSLEISDDKLNEIDDLIELFMAEGNIPGIAFGIISGDEIVYSNGYGYASPGVDYIDNETQFYIGSFTKSLTSLAIMQLSESGKIDLDVPFINYLPHMTFDDSLKDITVSMLLAQSGGLDSIDGIQFKKNQLSIDYSTWDYYKQLVINQEDIGEFEYSNINYNLLGLIIESISGISYKNYIQTNILYPMGLVNTIISHNDASKLSNGYSLWFNNPVYIKQAPVYENYFPAMGYISNLNDMMKYLSYFIDSEKNSSGYSIPQSIIDRTFSPVVESSFSGIDGYYASGWQTGRISGHNVYMIQGGTEGSNSYMYILPYEGIGFIVLTNMNAIFQTRHTKAMIPEILNILTGNEVQQVNASSSYTIILSILFIFLGINLISIIRAIILKKKKSIFLIVLHYLFSGFVIVLMYILMPAVWHISISAMKFGKPDFHMLMVLVTVFTIFSTTLLTVKHIKKENLRLNN